MDMKINTKLPGAFLGITGLFCIIMGAMFSDIIRDISPITTDISSMVVAGGVFLIIIGAILFMEMEGDRNSTEKENDIEDEDDQKSYGDT